MVAKVEETRLDFTCKIIIIIREKRERFTCIPLASEFLSSTVHNLQK